MNGRNPDSVLNKTAITFLSQNNRSFEDMMTDGMRLIVDIVDLDRLTLWRNFSKPGGLHMSQIYRWDKEEGGTTPPTAQLKDVPYSRFSSRWEQLLRKNQTINGPVDQLPDESIKAFFKMFGVVSAFVTPVFMDNNFWGFALFEDRHTERIFDADSAEMMRTAGFLCANAFIRGEMMNETETALFEAKEASRVKSDFLSRMSHEMLTPMHVITGMTQMSKKSLDNPRLLKTYLGEIEKASGNLIEIIRDVLDLSDKKDGAFEFSEAEFDFREMFVSVLDEPKRKAAEKNQKFTYEADLPIPASLIGDERHLSRVIGKLLTNAVKFTPEGGRIHTSVGVLEVKDDIIMLKFEISDNGIGISEEQKKSIFSIFEQVDGGLARKYGGAGLGLAISKRIVRMMGGKIWVDSEIGKGSKFTFTCKLKRTDG